MAPEQTQTHVAQAVDGMVRGYPGTTATCSCGWTSSWSTRDGSAERDAHDHMFRSDPVYKARTLEREAEWQREREAK